MSHMAEAKFEIGRTKVEIVDNYLGLSNNIIKMHVPTKETHSLFHRTPQQGYLYNNTEMYDNNEFYFIHNGLCWYRTD